MSSQQAKSVLSENIDQVSVFFFFCVLKEECGALQNIEQLSTMPKVEDKFSKEEIAGSQQVHALQILNDARKQFQDY
jgi:hypothetical protein